VPTAEPIKLYIEAKEAYDRGDREAAVQLLAQSLGADEPSDVLRNSIGKLLSRDTLANDAILQIISTEVAKSGGEEVF
jgi:hypothetical protein